MERISPETKVIYALLRPNFDQALEKRLQYCIDSTVQAIMKLHAKINQVLDRVNDIKVSLSVDIDKLRSCLDRIAHPDLESSKGAPGTSSIISGS